MNNVLLPLAGILAIGVATSQAALMVDVTGDANGSGSTWVFSGTTAVGVTFTLNTGTTFSAEINGFSFPTGTLSGEFASDDQYNNDNFVGQTILSGSVSGSTSGAFQFDGIYLDSDGAVGSDDFRWLIGNQAGHSFVNGETLTFSSYTLVTDLDITTFGEGDTAITQNGDSFTVTSLVDPPVGGFTMNFTAVPEPASSALIGFSGLALLLRRRR